MVDPDTALYDWMDEIRDNALRLADFERCALDHAACIAVSLLMARAYTTRNGSSLEQAVAFVCGVDELGELIGKLGGPEHPGLYTLASIHREVADFANVLLDLMVAGAF